MPLWGQHEPQHAAPWSHTHTCDKTERVVTRACVLTNPKLISFHGAIHGSCDPWLSCQVAPSVCGTCSPRTFRQWNADTSVVWYHQTRTPLWHFWHDFRCECVRNLRNRETNTRLRQLHFDEPRA